MAKSIRNQRMVTNPPKRLPNQQDSYESLRPKPTGPGVVSVKVPRPSDQSSPADARRHADGKNHKNPKARPVKSLLSRESDGGEKKYPTKPHLAKGVPNTAAMRKGYYPPDANLSQKKNVRGGPYEAEVEAHHEYS